MAEGRVTLVDTNVLLDIVTQDPAWADWSSARLAEAADAGLLAVNPIIYAELSAGYRRMEDLNALLKDEFERLPLPWAAGFLAGQCFQRYRKRGGTKRSPLPDFYIGAHAMVSGLTLLTRDAGRYQGYFPKLEVVAP